MSTLLPVFYVLLLLIPFHTTAFQQETWWPQEPEQQNLQKHLVPLQVYNDNVLPHFIRYLIPGMTTTMGTNDRSFIPHTTKRRTSSSFDYDNAVGLPISSRSGYSPDFGYKTRYTVAEDAAQDTLLRLKLLDPNGAGRRRRDTLSLSQFLGKRVLSLSKRH